MVFGYSNRWLYRLVDRFPTNMENVINEVFSWMTTSWAWLWLLAAFIIVAAAFVMLFSSYGQMKLGKPDDEPEISKLSWFSMLFGAAIAAGIVFYGPAEPAYHYMTPPPFFGGQAETAAAANNAMTTSFFHWGLTPWAIYVMLTIPLPTPAIPRTFHSGSPVRFTTLSGIAFADSGAK